MNQRRKKVTKHNQSYDSSTADKLQVTASKWTLIILAIVVLIGALHSQHLNLLFENDRYFSALSPLERELSFRTEMGLYYSYYKTIVDANSLKEGLHLLLYDNVTEYPSTMNTLRRFNLYPEVIIGTLYRGLTALNLDSNCFKVSRGYGQSSIETCTGISVAPYFYVYCVFGLNALLPMAIFLLTYYMSNSIIGGVLSVVMFFYNHGEATRVMWTPPLRESFSMPFLFLQFLVLTWILRQKHISLIHYIIFGATSLFFMLPWQFAQFTLLTQVVSLAAVYSINLIPPKKFLFLIITLLIMLLINVVLQFGNVLLLSSYLAFCLPVCLFSTDTAGCYVIFVAFGSAFVASMCAILNVMVACHKIFQPLKWIPLISLSKMLFVLLGTVMLKVFSGRVLGVQDDAHIGSILLSKFTSYKDFHTQLYTCADEFNFLSWSYPAKLSLTLLLPLAFVVTLKVLWQTILYVIYTGESYPVKKESVVAFTYPLELSTYITTNEFKLLCNNLDKLKSNLEHDSNNVEGSIVYHILQCLMFTIMSILIMRLKLFLTPQMCVLAGMVTSKRVFKLNTKQRYWIAGGIIGLASIAGFWNLNEQMTIIGEYNNPEMEQLVLWVNSSTPTNAVFAGAMPLMATIKLSTGRPIINHPHYEDAGIRERTFMVYTIYSQRNSETIHRNLLKLKAEYVVVEDAWCDKHYRPGCAFHDIYLSYFPEDKSNPLFCSSLSQNVPHPFTKVFDNKSYRVFRL